MKKYEYSLELLIGGMKLPETLTYIDAVTTDAHPLGAVLMRNRAGYYFLWHGGTMSVCNQREAAQYIAESKSMETAAGLVPIALYASMHGLNPATVRQKCIRGGWKTAVKVGRDWFIDPEEPHADLRKKSDKAE